MTDPIPATAESPYERWQAMVRFYQGFAQNPGWTCVLPLGELSSWVRDQTLAHALYPLTSLHSLCVSFVPGYAPTSPFFSIEPRRDGEFVFTLWAAVSHKVSQQACSAGSLRSTFLTAVDQLRALSAPQE